LWNLIRVACATKSVLTLALPSVNNSVEMLC
jgi:hypothetical protein